VTATYGNLRPLPFSGDDAALARALRAGHPSAKEALYDRHADAVRRVLIRTLGTSADVREHMHEVFLQAFSSARSLRDDSKLRPWLLRIAVNTGIAHIRKRRARRWLSFGAPEEIPEVGVAAADDVGRETLRQVYEVLDALPVEDRVAFSLRAIDGMLLSEIAEVCGVSIPTVKRRVARGEARFLGSARERPLLADWLERGDREGRA